MSKPLAPSGELPIWPGFDPVPESYALANAAIGQRTVDVVWTDGRKSRYHFRWLRDMCSCAECLNPVTREQMIDISSVPQDLRATAVAIDDVGALVVDWSQTHRSRFHPGWLRQHDYSNTGNDDDSAPVTWDSSFVDTIPEFDGREVLEDDRVLYEWLTHLRTYGLTRLRHLPTEPGIVTSVAKRIGIVRESNFGYLFDVRSKLNPDSNAYTPVALLPHTDLPTREIQPGLQMLHCLVNDATGGESVMVDGFRLAEVMRTEAPAAFDTITSTPIEYTNRALDTDYRYRTPMIVLDETGRVRELRPGVSLRAPIHASFDAMDDLYDAIQLFVHLTNDARLRVEFPIRAGDLLAFDNRRVLHARNAFDASSGERHLQGCYVDADEILSRVRVLERTRRARLAL